MRQKERVGRVDEIKGDTVKEMSELQGRYPGGKQVKPYITQTWLEETSIGSSNHPDQASNETLSTLKIGFESSRLLGGLLMGMVVSRGDEECGSSV